MSWSFHFVGTALDAEAAIRAERDKITNKHARAEFDGAVPDIIALLEQEYSESPLSARVLDAPIISIRANGGAFWKNGRIKSTLCHFRIKCSPGTHV